MAAVLEPEKIPSSREISLEESVDLNEECSENFTEFEELSYNLSEEGSLVYSGDSLFTKSSIGTYVTPEFSEEEILPDDPLIAVPPNDYPDMFFLLGNNFPKAIHASECIRSLIKWKKICPQQEIQILAPEGNYKNGLFFFSIFKGNFNGSAFCHEKTDKSILEEALANSRYLPTKDQYNMCRITYLNHNTFEALKTLFPKENWCTSRDIIMWLPWYCAREMEVHLPHGNFQIRELGVQHITLINESWQENFPGSKELLDDMLDVHMGLGLFQEDSLLSWALVWCHGEIGIIQTIEREKGKGYCRPVVEALTKRMGEHLTDVHLKITRGRKRDLFFFGALGFKYAYQSFSCETKKNIDKTESESKMKTLNIKKD